MNTIDYYRDNQTIINKILDLAQKKNQVVYGQQSINAQLPKRLNRETKDYDIYTNKPKHSAKELVKNLNKEYGSEKFKVEKALHKGTFKVKSDEGTVVDYTYSNKKPKSKKILGISYANVNYQRKKLNKRIKDESQVFHREKDLDTLEKIKQNEIRSFLR